MRNSLHEGFKQQFEDALQNIMRLSGEIKRAAQQGSNAEVRVVRLEVQDIAAEIQDIRTGLTGEVRKLAQTHWQLHQAMLAQQKISLEQNRLEHEKTRRDVVTELSQLMQSRTYWKNIGMNATSFLQNEYVNATYLQQSQMTIAYHGSQKEHTGPLADLMAHETTHPPSMEAKPGTRIEDLQEWSVILLDYVQKGAGFQTLSQDETPVFFDRRVVFALEDWLQAEQSKLLYLESPSYITAAAMRIVISAGSMNPPMLCASFFCRAQELDEELEVQTREVDPLLGLVCSLIYQILRVLPPLTEQTLITSKERFTDVDSTLPSCERALELLKDTLNLAPALMLIVIDGLLAFEDEHEDELKNLLDVLRKQMKVEGKVLKVLLTTDRMLFSIIGDLEADEMKILDAGTQQTRGMMPFIPGGEVSDHEYD